MSYPKPFSFNRLHTYSLFERPSKVGVSDLGRPVRPGSTMKEFLAGLPLQLAAKDIREVAARWARAVKDRKSVMFAMGAHVIKVGLTPLLIDLMDRGLISGFALNGAGVIHDSELAMAGKTSEDVSAVLGSGAFGAARETGQFLNKAIGYACERDIGLGRAVGECLLEASFPYNEYSLLAQAAERKIPVTIHVAIGTDIIHIHPDADGAKMGRATFTDFQIFCSLVSGLQDGVYFNIGSAVILPEVFLKALTAVRNLGYTVDRLTTVNLDFIRQYRPLTNVVSRPTLNNGKGYSLTGHHEIMLPLLSAAVMEELNTNPSCGGK